MHPDVSRALEAISKNKLIAIPTETVYGLAAPINNEELIEKIFTIKERPFFDPLIVHVANHEMAKQCVKSWPAIAQRLADHFWPGPLTLVLPKNENTVSHLITAGLDSVGIRMPNHPMALELIKAYATAFAAPSANKFKKTSPTKPEHVEEAFSSDNVYIMRGGECSVGIESTILEIKNDHLRILRPGMIELSKIQEALTGLDYQIMDKHNAPIMPGTLDEHYRPEKPLYFFKGGQKLELENYLANNFIHKKMSFIELPRDEKLAARLLYSNMRTESKKENDLIILHLPDTIVEDIGWEAIIDRIQRAATQTISLRAS